MITVTILTLALSVFMLAYLRECGKTVELKAKIERLERGNRPDFGHVIEVDFRRH